MSVIGEAFVAVRPDSSGFGPEAEKGVLGSVGSIAKKAAVVLGGAFAATKGIDFLKDSVAEARESNKVAAQTAAAIKSTGGAAHVTASEVDKLAGSIAAKTGIDDEAIASASNLLLTFTGVRNEVGKGNDIFNQATKIATDMGAALGTDASGSAIQLGKALNDPIKGITALTRVGVTFSEQQKDQIKKMQESGNLAGAQKVILAELTKEFGGSAEAQATSSAKLGVAFGNIKEQVGNLLIPVIDRLASFLADKLPGAIEATKRAFDRVKEAVTPVVTTIRNLWTTLSAAFQENDTFGLTGKDGLEGKAAVVGKALRQVSDFVRAHLKPILIGLGVAIVALTSPITAVVGGLIYLYVRFQAVRDAVAATVRGIKAFVGFLDRDVRPAVEAVAHTIADGFGNLAESVGKRLAPLVEAVQHIIKAIEIGVAIWLAPILLAWRVFGDSIMAYVKGVFDAIRIVVETALRVIGDVIDVVLSLINGDWGKAWDALKDIPAAVFGGLKDLVSSELNTLVGMVRGLPGKLLGLVGDLAGAGLKMGGAIMEGLGKGIAGAANFAKDIGKSVLNAIIRFVDRQVIDRINDALDITIKGPGWLPDIHLNPPDIPRIKELAAGGIARARAGGVVARIAEAGTDEAVLPLPPGLLSGLQALGDMAHRGVLGGGVNVTLVAPPERNAGREVIQEMLAVQYLGVGGLVA